MAMTMDDKLTMVKALLNIDSADETENDRITVYLSVAEKEILSWRYSYLSEKPTEVPEEYEMTQVYAVVAGYSQSGAENQIGHSENGISRTFKFSDMIQYIRTNVIPFAKVVM